MFNPKFKAQRIETPVLLIGLSLGLTVSLAALYTYSEDVFANDHTADHSAEHTTVEHEAKHHDVLAHSESGHETAKTVSGHAHHDSDLHTDHHAKPHTKGFFAKTFAPLIEIYEGYERKLAALRELDENYEKMQLRVVKLEGENQLLKSEKAVWFEYKRANEIKSYAKNEGGVEHARTIASIESKNEDILTKKPSQVYDLAIKAFGREDYERASFAFVSLINNDAAAEFVNAETYFMAGVSLYKLDNFKTAEKYFRKTLDLVKNDKREPASVSGSVKNFEEFAPRAMAWWSLCRSRVGDIAGAKRIIHELIEWYPKSKEARRLNRNESFN